MYSDSEVRAIGVILGGQSPDPHYLEYKYTKSEILLGPPLFRPKLEVAPLVGTYVNPITPVGCGAMPRHRAGADMHFHIILANKMCFGFWEFPPKDPLPPAPHPLS